MDLVRSFGFTLVITLAQLPGYAAAAVLVEAGEATDAVVVPGRLRGRGADVRHRGRRDHHPGVGHGAVLLQPRSLGRRSTPSRRGLPDGTAGDGTGWAAGFGRIASIIAPLSVPFLRERGGDNVLLFAVFAGFFGLAAVATWGCPSGGRRPRRGRREPRGRSIVKDVVRRLPGWVWHALVLEVAMYRNLLRWAFRRPAVGRGEEPVGYAQAVTPVMALWIFASAAEMPLHVLIPWHTVRVVNIVLGVWTLVWMLGILAGLVHLHTVSAAGLRVRNGAFTDVLSLGTRWQRSPPGRSTCPAPCGRCSRWRPLTARTSGSGSRAG